MLIISTVLAAIMVALDVATLYRSEDLYTVAENKLIVDY